MAQTQPTRLFDASTLARFQARAKARAGAAPPFLIKRCAEDLAERMQDVNRSFQRMALVGPLDWRAAITDALPPSKRPERFDHLETPSGEDYDLVVSLLHIQSVDDVGGVMRGIRAMLKPDGLFIGAVVGGESLTELRGALYAVDTERRGSPAPRVHPMIEVRAAAQLLGHAGLAIPVSDSDRFTVRYRSLSTLLADLRDVGLSNALASRERKALPRSTWRALEEHLRPSPGEPMPVSWEIVWMTGWAPHASQQKPLAPGSAKMPLNAALRAVRDGE